MSGKQKGKMIHANMKAILITILYITILNYDTLAQGGINIERKVDLASINRELEYNSTITSVTLFNVWKREEFDKIPFSRFTPDSVTILGLYSVYDIISFDFIYLFKNLRYLSISASSLNLNTFDFSVFPHLKRLRIEFTPTDTLNGSLSKLDSLTQFEFITRAPLKYVANTDSILRQLQFFKTDCSSMTFSPILIPILSSCPNLSRLEMNASKCESDFSFLSQLHIIDTLEIRNINPATADNLFRQFSNESITNVTLKFVNEVILPTSINEHQQIRHLEVQGSYLKDISSVSLAELKTLKVNSDVFDPNVIIIPRRRFRPNFLEMSNAQLGAFKKNNPSCAIITSRLKWTII
jgi:hypothetical protein